ncbi:MAG TPA: metal ABC transporter permease [Kineosporiaceae bacterium]|jgi:zinc transport system permease protein|nr:metal ABC transporter permease [Kineosporiaceae bacterium]
MPEFLQYEFMQRALVAALLVGLCAPVVGTFLVQRQLSLIGDGIGHVALTGVGVGLLTGTAPVWTALLAAVTGAATVELVRARGRTSGDVALAVMFYGGLAGGAVLIASAPHGSSGGLDRYLFGAIGEMTDGDLAVFAGLAGAVLVVVAALAPRLFAASNDEEYARAVGMNVTGWNLLVAVLAAVTVVVSMRVVGLLLISALMIVPNAVALLVARSFAATVVLAVAVGIAAGLTGTVASFYANTPPGGTIVLLAVAVFLLAALATSVRDGVRRRRHPVAGVHDHEHGPACGHEEVPHDDHVDYVHAGHRHAPHGGHYDEH